MRELRKQKVTRVTDDPRIARIAQGIAHASQHAVILRDGVGWTFAPLDAALADLLAWQEIAKRHNCAHYCPGNSPARFYSAAGLCPDHKAADDALDRLDALWGSETFVGPQA